MNISNDILELLANGESYEVKIQNTSKDHVDVNGKSLHSNGFANDEELNLFKSKLMKSQCIERDLSEDKVLEIIFQNQNVNKYLLNKEIKKKIFVSNRLMNIIV